MPLDAVLHLIASFGYIALFALLVGGLVGIPVPDEMLLMVAGYLVFKGGLNGPGAAMAAFLGSICGITITYFLGRTGGYYLIKKLFSFFNISQDRLAHAVALIGSRGRWAMPLSYFMPGLRQATPFTAGTLGIRFAVFAAATYPAGLVWAAAFVALGYYAGEEWLNASQEIHRCLGIGALVITVLLMCAFIVRLRYFGKQPGAKPIAQ